MSSISNKIEAAYQKVDINEARQDISPEYVDEAINVLSSFRVNDAKGLFYYLAAISLLNAAIKMKKYKTGEQKRKRLSYFFIKGKARTIVEFVIAKRNFENVSYYYNANERCLYIKVLDVVFSFHQVEETNFIRSIAAKEPVITWSGIKLQWIAEYVFRLAKEFMI